MWMRIISLVVIIFLTAIIAALLVGWQDSHYDEDAPYDERYYRELAAKLLVIVSGTRSYTGGLALKSE